VIALAEPESPPTAEGQGLVAPDPVPAAKTQRGPGGKFKKLSNAERIRRLHKKGLKNAEIAKKLGIRPQVVHRALHRGDSQRVYVGKAVVAAQLERLEATAEGEEPDIEGAGDCDDRCQSSFAKTCECQCNGTNHGILNRA